MSNQEFLQEYEKTIKKFNNENQSLKQSEVKTDKKNKTEKDQSHEYNANATESMIDEYLFSQENEASINDIIDENAFQTALSINSNNELFQRGNISQNESQSNRNVNGSQISSSGTKLIIVG